MPKCFLPCEFKISFKNSANLNFISSPIRNDEMNITYYDLLLNTPVGLAAAEGNKTVTLNDLRSSLL